MSKNYVIVKDNKSYDLMANSIKSCQYLAYDTETTGLNPRKDTVIGFSTCSSIGNAFYFPLYEWDVTTNQLVPLPLKNKAIDLLNLIKQKQIICHNASYDIRITKNNLGVDLLDNLIADTMLMKHTVDENPPFGLKDIAIIYQRELGLNMEEEANKEQIALKEHLSSRGASTTKTNYELYKGDSNIIGEYGAADADLTLRLFELLYKKIEQEGLLEFFFDDEVMPLYRKVTIPMEDKGVPLDIELIQQTKANIEKDISLLEAEIQNEFSSICPEYIEEIKEKLYPVKNKGKFAEELASFFNLNLPLTNKGKRSLSKYYIDELPDNRYKSFLQGDLNAITKEEVETIRKILNKKEQESDYYLNINSKDSLGHIYFNILKETPLSTTEKGKPQLDDDMLDLLSKKYNSAKLIRDYNKLIKIKGTYIERFLEEQEDGMFYPSFKQHGTISGRYGSDMQQLPRPKEEGQQSELVLKYTNAIRTFFIAGKNHKFIDNDYCLDKDTEYLTLDGWKKITELTEKDYIWQIEKFDIIALIGKYVIPSRIIKKQYTGVMYDFRSKSGISIKVTKNHRMVWDKNDGKFYTELSQDSEVKDNIHALLYNHVNHIKDFKINMTGFYVDLGFCPIESKVEYTVEDELVGCVTVPSGYILVRQNGVVFVTGNCSLEPTVFSHVSTDEGLKDIFRKDLDFYSTIAIKTEGLYEYSADKNADNYLGKKNKSKRQMAKGYCLTEKSIIQTKTRGFISIKDATIGDEVLTKHGYKKITNVFKRRAEVLELQTTIGIIQATKDHKIYSNGDFIEAGKLNIKNEVEYNKYNSTESLEYVKVPLYTNASIKKDYNYNKISDLEITEEWAYVIGAFLGDGVGSYVVDKTPTNQNSHRMSGYIGICGVEDDNVLDKFMGFFENLGYKYRTTVNREKSNFKTHVISDIQLTHIFYKSLDLIEKVNNKNQKKLRVPLYILNSKTSVKLSFLAGLLDTDGYVKRTGKILSASLCSKSQFLISDVCVLLNSIGCESRIHFDFNKKYNRFYYIVRIGSIAAFNMNKLGIHNFMVCQRKKEAFALHTDHKYIKPQFKPPIIRSISNIGEQDVYDVTVEDAHEFIANNIRVHNCLGIPYGMGPYALGKTLEIPTEEAERLCDGYLNGFPNLKKWMDDTHAFVKKHGYVKSQAGRIRHLPEVKRLYEIYQDNLLDPSYIKWLINYKRLNPEDVYKMKSQYKNGLNNAKNFQIQSLSASIVNRAAIKIAEYIEENSLDAYVCLQVHDQLVIRCEESIAKELSSVIQSIMENIYKLDVDLKAPPQIANNLKDGH